MTIQLRTIYLTCRPLFICASCFKRRWKGYNVRSTELNGTTTQSDISFSRRPFLFPYSNSKSGQPHSEPLRARYSVRLNWQTHISLFMRQYLSEIDNRRYTSALLSTKRLNYAEPGDRVHEMPYPAEFKAL